MPKIKGENMIEKNNNDISLLKNKSFVTNLLAFTTVLVGLILPDPYREPILNIGFFALSGALTNWLAIHMLFEKVPGLYGSGVIPARFNDFKRGIHNLIIEQFFTKHHIEHFFEKTEDHQSFNFDFNPIIESTDFNPAFDVLVSVIEESPFGGMLAMIGGSAALEPLKEPFTQKMKESFKEIVQTESFQKNIQNQLKNSSTSDEILETVGLIVDKRLNELTPKMVKEIIQKMIRDHLGWLVIWGGVFGGIMGLVMYFIFKLI